jgi:Ca2+-binding RTX toxin-like protein
MAKISSSKNKTTLKGTNAADTLTVKHQQITVTAGKGKDKINVISGSKHNIYGEAGNDTITIGSKAGSGSKIYGDDAKNKLTGKDTFNINGGKKNTFYGGKGADTFNINGGTSNYLYGGAGNDVFVIGKSSKGKAIIKDFSVSKGNTDTVKVTGSAVKSIAVSGKNMIVKGGTSASLTLQNAKSKTFTVTDTLGTYTVSGANIKLALGKTYKGTLNAASFITTLDGRSDANAVTIKGNAKNNTIYGGGGANTIYGDSGNDTLYGEAGKDTLYGGVGNDTLTGGAGNDTFVYANGDGNDTIKDYAVGQDTLQISSGSISKTALANSNKDLVFTVGTGKITLSNAATMAISLKDSRGSYTASNTAITLGSDFTGTMNAGNYLASVKTIDGRKVTKAANITGNAQDNTIYAGQAGGTIDGGAGNDTLYGGAGSDTFVYSGGHDTVYDYSVADIIRLASTTFTGSTFSGNDVILNLANSGNITVKDAKGINIRLVDSEGTEQTINNSGSGTIDDNIVSGSEGEDTFIYSPGDGDTIIKGYAEGEDTLQIAGGTVTNTQIVNGNIVLTVGDAGNTITLEGAAGKTIDIQDSNGSFTLSDEEIRLGSEYTGNLDAAAYLATVTTIDGRNAKGTVNITGNDLGNTIYAGQAGGTINGDAGNDTLYGGEGVDTLTGGAGSDTLSGDAGNDTLTSDGGNDTLIGGTGSDNYIISSAFTADTLISIDQTDFTAGDADTLTLNTLNHDAVSYALDEGVLTITDKATGGKVTVDGWDVNPLSQIVFADNESMTGEQINDIISNTVNIVSISNNEDINYTVNHPKNKFVFSGSGWSAMIYGTGSNDTLDFSSYTDGQYGFSSNYRGGDHLYLTFSKYNEAGNTTDVGTVYIMNYFAADEKLGKVALYDNASGEVRSYNMLADVNGGAGNDLIFKNTEDDNLANVIDGGAGNDVIYGSRRSDTLNGGAGNDKLYGNDGDDTLAGGAGDDKLYGGTGNDTFFYSSGHDTILDYTEGQDTLEIDGGTITGTSLTNSDVVFTVGSGSVTLENGSGKTISIQDSRGSHTASDTTITLGSDFTGTLDANAYLSTVTKIDARNVEGAVNITGNDQGNTIYAGKLGGTIDGGAGDDKLYGGAGSDTFVYTSGNDTIYDYAVADTIKLASTTLTGSAVSGNDAILELANGETITVKNAANLDIRIVDTNGKEVTVNNSGGAGGNISYGTEGADTFVYAAGSGNTTIKGYEESQDTIEISGGTITGTSLANHDVVFTVGSGSVTVENGSGKTISIKDSRGSYTASNTAIALGADFTGNMDANTYLSTVTMVDGRDVKGAVNITGNDQDNTIYAGKAGGTIDGGAGEDTLYGGVGNDELHGGTGKDELYGGVGNDTLTGGAGDDTLNGGDGNDTLISDAGNDTLIGGTGSDTYIISSAFTADTVIAIDQTDFKAGDSDILTLNTLNHDAVSYALDEGVLTITDKATGGKVTVDGWDENPLSQIVFADNESISSDQINEILSDTVNIVPISDNESDTYTAEHWKNRFVFSGSNWSVWIVGAGSNDTLDFSSYTDGQYGFSSNYRAGDNLYLTFSKFDNTGNATSIGTIIIRDYFAADEKLGTVALYDNASGEVRSYNMLADTNGGAGNDFIFKNTEDGDLTNVIDGGAGNDVIYGSRGNDTLNGGAGDDAIYGGRGNDTLYGGAGNDTLDGGAGDDTLYGGVGNDTLTGGAGKDTFVYANGDGNDTVKDYTAGQDTLEFSDGSVTQTTLSGANVVFTVGSGSVTVENGSGKAISIKDNHGSYTVSDTAITLGSDFAGTLDANEYLSTVTKIDGRKVEGAVNITGNDQNNTIYAGKAGGTIDGGAGEDTLYGGVGNDTLTGGAGDDKLYGGDGSDTFVYSSGHDTIFDYSSADTIKLASTTLTDSTASGDDVILNLANGEAITVKNAANMDIRIVDTNGKEVTVNNSNGAGNSNIFYGTEGADTFAYAVGSGNTTIKGYEESQDTLEISGGTITGTRLSNQDVVFTVGSGSVTVENGSGKIISIKDSRGSYTASDTTIALGADFTGKMDADAYLSTVTMVDGRNVKGAVNITGNDQNNTIYAGKSGGTIDGGSGNDTLYGGAGSDTFVYSSGHDTIYDYAGTDTIKLASATLTSSTVSGDDVILDLADGGKITVKDAKGTDVLLIDSEGKEQIVDSSVNGNTVYGSSGADTFVYTAGSGNTIIKGLEEGQDKLKINDGTITGTSLANQDVVFTVGSGTVTVENGSGKAISIEDSRGSYTVSNTAIELGAGFTGNMDAGAYLSTVTAIDGNAAERAVNITGNGQNNVIYAGKAGGALDGGVGDDTLYGGAGSDTFVYSSGHDTIYDYAGADKIKLASATLTGSLLSGNDVILSLSDGGKITVKDAKGTDILLIDSEGKEQTINNSGSGSTYDSVVLGSEGSDTFVYDAGSGNTIIKGYEAGQDILKINGGTITGTSLTNNDIVFTVGSGSVTVENGSGKAISIQDSRGSYTASDTTITLGSDFTGNMDSGAYLSTVTTVDGRNAEGVVNITGNGQNNVIYAGKSGGAIDGGAGDDKLYGGAGNDTFVYSSGDDTIYDYSGADQIKLASATLTGSTASGNDVILALADGGKITVKDAKGTDVLLIDSEGKEQIVDSSVNGNTVYGSSGADAFVYATGSGNTRIIGYEEGQDTVEISGGAVSGTALANSNKDLVFTVGNGTVTLTDGADKTINIKDSRGSYTASDTAIALGSDFTGMLDAGAYLSTVTTVDGSAAESAVNITGNGQNNVIYAGKAGGTLDGGTGDDTLYGGAGNDILNGGADNDMLHGGAGDDELSGGTGSNKLYGGAGNDTLISSAGNDTLTGGTGSDTYIISSGFTADTLIAIDQAGFTAGDVDILKLQTLNHDAVAYSLEEGVLTITDNATGGKVTVAGWDVNPLSEIVFGDNESITSGQINEIVSDTNNIIPISDNASGTYTAEHWKNTFVFSGSGWSASIRNAGSNDTLDFSSYTDGQYGFSRYNRSGDTLNLTFSKFEESGSTTRIGTVYLSNYFAADDKLEKLALYDNVSEEVRRYCLVVDASGSNNHDYIFKVTKDDDPDNVLDGGAGNDVIYGSSGIDTLNGGAGDDTLYGGDGDDLLNGGIDNDTLYGGYNDDILNGGAGDDVLYGDNGVDTLNGDDGDDELHGGSGNDTLNGGVGNDTLYGDSGNDILNGGDGDDILYGVTGNNTLNGDAGNDTLYGGDSNSTLNGGDGKDILYGGTWSDILNGDDGDDELHGAGSSDTLNGGVGDDTLYGGDGQDTFIYASGEGNDIIKDYNYGNNSSYSEMLQITGGIITNSEIVGDNVVLTVGTGTVTLEGAIGQTLRIEDANGTYTVSGTEIALYQDYTGTMDVNRYFDTVETISVDSRAKGITIIGNAQDNIIYDGYDSDTLYGGDGNDTIKGYQGDDILYGEAGDDKLYGGDGGDKLYGGEGDDYLQGDAGDDTLYGSAGNDTLYGGAGNDTFVFDKDYTGNNTISSYEEGNDVVHFADDMHITGFSYDKDSKNTLVLDLSTGGTVNFSYSHGKTFAFKDYNDGDFVVAVGTIYDDSLSGTSCDDILYGNYGNDILNGGDGNDILYGAYGADTLNGGAGNDELYGDEGADILNGGAGNDMLYGGAGKDTFIYVAGEGQDVIKDYTENEDTLTITNGVVTQTEISDGNLVFTAVGGTVTLEGAAGKTIAMADGNGSYTASAGAITLGSDYFGTLDSSAYLAAVTTFDGSKATGEVNIVGNSRDNVIYAGKAGGFYRGEAGNDTLYTGKGTDILTGGAGNDTFVYAAGDGNDIVTDYTEGEDNLQVSGGTISQMALANNGQDVVFTVGDGSVTLEGAAGKTITVADGNGSYTASAETITLGSDFVAGSLDASTFSETLTVIDAQAVTGAIAITGNANANTIYVGACKSSVLTGGQGADSFIFVNPTGNHTIADYEHGTDVLRFDTDTVTDSTVSGTDIVLTLSGGATVTVKNRATQGVAFTDATNSVLSLNPAITQQSVIKSFMKSLDDTTLIAGTLDSAKAALDAALTFASNHTYTSWDNLVKAFKDDIKAYAKMEEGNDGDWVTITNSQGEDVKIVEPGIDRFLKDYCGIILMNDDTGAITGWDAGGATVKTAESIVPETGTIDGLEPPASSVATTINGLTFHWPENPTASQQTMINALNAWWAKGGLNLIEESYGLSFTEEGATVTDINVIFENKEKSSTLASVTSRFYNNGETYELTLTINMKYYDEILDVNGASDDANGYFLDRTIAHELTHAVMAANITGFSYLPKCIKEGTAELVHGVDDERVDEILHLSNPTVSGMVTITTTTITNGVETTTSETLSKSDARKRDLTDAMKFDGDSYYAYAGGYMLLRYFAKQVADYWKVETTTQSNAMLASSATDSSESLVNLASINAAMIDFADNTISDAVSGIQKEESQSNSLFITGNV